MTATVTTSSPATNMALGQLYTNEITSQTLLDALESTPRELFVPSHLSSAAYVDDELEIGEGRWLLSPLDSARLLQLAEIQPTDRVLDVGCGMGYLSAAAARIARDVAAIDTIPLFIQKARENCTKLGCDNVEVSVVEHLTDGLPPRAPYDAILINGAVDEAPAALFQQLADGGRLVCIRRIEEAAPGTRGLGRFATFIKRGVGLTVKEGVETSAPLLTGFHSPSPFSFG